MKRMSVAVVSAFVIMSLMAMVLPAPASAFRWTIQTINPAPNVGKENMIQVGTDGRVHIAYIDSSQWTVRHAVQNGASWDDKVVALIDEITDYGRHIDMALDSHNWPRIVYLNTTGSYHANYAEWDGSQWVIRYVTIVNPRCHLRIDVDSAGQPHIAIGENFRVVYAEWNGAMFLLTKLDVDYAGNYADIDVDGADTVRVAYQGVPSLGGNLTIATRVGVSWIRELVEDTPTGEAEDIWITSDSQNRPHIVYYNKTSTSGSTRYAVLTPTGWNITTVTAGQNPALALDSADRPYVAIQGPFPVAGELTFWNGTGWQKDSWGGPSDMFGMTIALDATDLPVIAYGCSGGLQIAFSAVPIIPSAPLNLVASGGNGQIALTWSAPASNGGLPIQTYWIYRGLSSGTETFLAAPGKVFYYLDTPVTNGVTYWYYVTAVNGIGEGPVSNEANAIPSSPPALSDGSVSPSSGSPTTDFVWQVTYTDSDDDPPMTGYPIAHVRKAGIAISGSPFQMAEVDPLDVTFTDGKAYRYNRSLSSAGTDYSFIFSAKDCLGYSAANTPTSSGPTVALPHTPPVLDWTGEPGYESEGVEPDIGYKSGTFTFRVKYSDVDGSPPTSSVPVLDIWRAGNPIPGSPWIMSFSSWVGANDDYVAGAVYEKKLTLSNLGTDYSHRCLGGDTLDVAVGNATILTDGPDVVDRIPRLEWTGEAGFESDGINPDSGDMATTFEWRINYTDDDNDAPNGGYPRVHVLKGGTEIGNSPFRMTAVSAADTTCSDGKLYRYSKTLAGGSDYTYYVEAVSLSSQNTTATMTGPQVSLPPNKPPTITLNSPAGGESWYVSSTHQIAWSMDDEDDGASTLTVVIFLLNGSDGQGIGGPILGQTSFAWSCPAFAVSAAKVQVVVTDPHGDNASDTSGPFDIVLRPVDTTPPVARMSVSPSSPAEGEQVTLDASQSSDDSGTIVSYSWSIYDEGGSLLDTLTGAVQTYVFASHGTYRIDLNVTDLAGNWDVDTKQLTVSEGSSEPEPTPFPIWIPIAAILVICILLVTVLVWRRSRKSDSKKGDSGEEAKVHDPDRRQEPK